MKQIETCVHLYHSLVIWAICNQILQEKHCTIQIIILELFLTISRVFVYGQTVRKIQTILSISLCNNILAYKWNCISWLYLFKIIHLHETMNRIRYESFINQQSFLRIIFDFFRSSVIFYLCLKIIGFVYGNYFQVLPMREDYALLYQFIVTASSVGYGENRGKSSKQIYFFIIAIPILCSIFVIYYRKLIQIYTNFIKYYQGQTQDADKKISLE